MVFDSVTECSYFMQEMGYHLQSWVIKLPSTSRILLVLEHLVV